MSYKLIGRATTKEDNEAISGLRVQLWDKDIGNVDEFLGETMTDELGEFTIEFKDEDFTHWGVEEKPDLYLIVTNKNGVVVYNSEEKVMWEAKEEEIIYVRVPKDLVNKEQGKTALESWEQIIEKLK